MREILNPHGIVQVLSTLGGLEGRAFDQPGVAEEM